jgi:hypothetical protein
MKSRRSPAYGSSSEGSSAARGSAFLVRLGEPTEDQALIVTDEPFAVAVRAMGRASNYRCPAPVGNRSYRRLPCADATACPCDSSVSGTFVPDLRFQSGVLEVRLQTRSC